MRGRGVEVSDGRRRRPAHARRAGNCAGEWRSPEREIRADPVHRAPDADPGAPQAGAIRCRSSQRRARHRARPTSSPAMPAPPRRCMRWCWAVPQPPMEKGMVIMADMAIFPAGRHRLRDRPALCPRARRPTRWNAAPGGRSRPCNRHRQHGRPPCAGCRSTACPLRSAACATPASRPCW